MAKFHSIETCGTVDGPGIRYVIFFQGCPLRCRYCHNPDTWNINNGNDIELSELIKDIKKYKNYMIHSNGGITASGGEPLMQAEFVKELFVECKKIGINTALDTSGSIFTDKTKEVLEYTDLVLLDIKSINDQVYKDLTNFELSPTLKFAEYLNEKQIKVWVRYVLVPGVTDNLDDVRKLADFISNFDNIEKVEVLPFHKMGEYKWENLNLKYSLSDTQPPDNESIKNVTEILNGTIK